MIEIGWDLEKLDTPSLWVDLNLMEQNIHRLSEYMRSAGVAWRPHTKGIKIPAIAHKLLDAGAIGITCSKLSEAEVMAKGGIRDILVANQVVGSLKIARLVNLRRHADVMVAIDDFQNAKEISHAAEFLGVKIRVLIELDIGMYRSGIQPGEETVNFARKISTLPGITLSGLMGWEGHVTKIEDPSEKQRQTEKAVYSLVEAAESCRAVGLEIPIVSCGGTGSYRISANIPGVTEIQAGGGIFGDLTYEKWGADIDCSLFILSTICSHTRVDHAVLDAGRKAMNVEHTMPGVKDLPGARIAQINAEHCVLDLPKEIGSQLRMGDKVNFIAGYEDMTLILHDKIYGIRDDKVEVIWDIQGRGKLT
ncbi:MAG: DSD1 family PLP-dependent enzyme [Chloroflexi bacterium]|nr:DSD1 family PLP-dependent enzyme [Chloroflexota bacterium]